MNKNLLSDTPKSPMQKAEKLIELQAILKEIKPQIDELKADLLKVTQQLDVYTLKTGSYTISRAKRVTPHIVDFETLKSSLEKENIPFDTVVEESFAPFMIETFKKAIEEGRKLDGLEGVETEYISVRVKEGGEKHE